MVMHNRFCGYVLFYKSLLQQTAPLSRRSALVKSRGVVARAIGGAVLLS